MVKKIVLTFSLLIGFLITTAYPQLKNDAANLKLKNVLGNLKNHRFGPNYYYQVKDLKVIKASLQQFIQAEGTPKVAMSDEILKKVDKKVAEYIENGVKADDAPMAIKENLYRDLSQSIPDDDFDALYAYFKSKLAGKGKEIKTAYLITTPNEKGDESIVALIIAFKSIDIEEDIGFPAKSNIFTYMDLKEIDITDEANQGRKLYDLLNDYILQQNVNDVTLRARGIGQKQWLLPFDYGVTSSLIVDEGNITSNDVQNFIRISETMPLDFFQKENEIILSGDQISWRRYKRQLSEDGSEPAPIEDKKVKVATKAQPGPADKSKTATTQKTALVAETPTEPTELETDPTKASNYNLPDYGIELKYGIDEINFPSLWSERLTLSAIWQSVKLGVILPSDGSIYSSSANVFGQKRQFTNAGTGIAGSFDFPIKVAPKSGIFHMDFAYVNGNANPASYRNKLERQDTSNTDPYLDYLIRANAQIHYTFATKIDDNYWLRYSVGATLYNIESWSYENSLNYEDGDKESNYKQKETETVGGISGKIELMVRDITTPWGASVQYFDGTLSTYIWLRIPITRNSVSFQIDGKGYFPVFDDLSRPWKNTSAFIPMGRLIVNF
ncbi:MAG: hypothetical protein HW421_1003 [Ignavibacteria bacterium]|nr:hypothetical protein [Ignavibacteria bacterium]